MPQRVATRTRLQQPGFRPAAAVRAVPEAPQAQTAVEQMASALQDIQPSLTRYAGALRERKNAQERSSGEATARELVEQGVSLKEAIESGRIRKDESEWFRVGAYETFGRAEGGRYIGNFLEELNKNPSADSMELADFDQFEREFRERYVTERLSDSASDFTLNAFGSSVDARMESIRNSFAEQAGKRMERKVQDEFHAELFSLIESFRSTDFSSSEIAAAVRLAQDRQVVTGAMNYDEVNRITASAIASAAVRMRDFKMLDIIDQIPTSAQSKGYLGGTSYGVELRRQAETAISNAMDEDARRQEIQLKREREAVVSSAVNSMVDVLNQDPGADVTPFIDAARKADSGSVTMMYSVREAVRGGQLIDDPGLIPELADGIYLKGPGELGYTTQADLNRALAEKRLTLNTFRALSADIQERDSSGGAGRYLTHTAVQAVGSQVQGVLNVQDGVYNWTPSQVEAGRQNAASAANEARYQMIQWLKANPDATESDMQVQIDRIGREVVARRSQIRRQLRSGIVEPQGPTELAPRNIKPGQFFVASPTAAAQLEREFTEIREQRRGNFSTEMLRILRDNNINERSAADIEKFITEQNAWIASQNPRP